jgi:protein-L-isoaspartate(D-aspartate) O-methyltransferase
VSLADAARRRGVTGPLLAALAEVPRALHVVPEARSQVDQDAPLPIGAGHHQAEPSILARMLQLAGAAPGRRLIVLGAGTGYAAALAAAVGAEVTAVEREASLAEVARRAGLRVEEADVFHWHPPAPVDAILLGGAVRSLSPWLDDLAPGGALVAPVGDDRRQELVTLTRTPEGFDRRGHGAVRFELLTPGRAPRGAPG